MSSLYYLYPSSDHLSVEVNSDGFPFPSNQYDSIIDPNLNSLFDFDPFTPEFNIAGVCESGDLVGKIR